MILFKDRRRGMVDDRQKMPLVQFGSKLASGFWSSSAHDLLVLALAGTSDDLPGTKARNDSKSFPCHRLGKAIYGRIERP
jgi:hypothetical protein